MTSNPKRLLVYGDSNSWGWVPRSDEDPHAPYPADVRWTGRMAAALAPTVDVVVDALSGRTCDLDDPITAADFPPLAPEDFNGLAGIARTMAVYAPVDAVVIMLGTNDVKPRFNRTAENIAAGFVAVAAQARAAAGGVNVAAPDPAILMIAPPPVAPVDAETSPEFAGGDSVSRAVADALATAATAAGLPMIDGGTVVPQIGGVDAVHFTPDDHARLADLVTGAVRGLLAIA